MPANILLKALAHPMAVKAEWSWPLVSSIMKDIIMQSRSNANQKMNAKLKNKGYIAKSGRRRLDAIPLVDPHREAVTPIAPAPSQFQKSVQNSRQKLHSFQEEPQLVVTPPSPFLSKSQRYFIHLLRKH